MTLKGDLAPVVSRPLFLVKWLLIIPHIVVLLFLWIGACVAWIAAFCAILFTGKYPRGLFDFNVGVLRWSWRVGFYSYQALGTDKYPPFTLKSVPDYPADLTVAYPGRLSQGRVLIKWWLLAIPHYLIVIVLQGGGHEWGLLNLFVLIAAVANLFTGKYPLDIFNLVMGMDRWIYRVCVYALLMTDQYPPFRLEP
jgi:hypothetical protein